MPGKTQRGAQQHGDPFMPCGGKPGGVHTPHLGQSPLAPWQLWVQPFSPPLPFTPQGIWRIPVDEIDRPGSFAWHMNRSIVLLLKVLAQLRDHGTLLRVSSMLQRTPDQGK